MNPAYSVIFFTTASGAGYGLLALLGIVGFNHGEASSPAFALTTVFVALALITSGLLASTFHLGHPERAWRALSQWQSSWLSREGIAAVATYIPALAFGFVWSGLFHAPQFIGMLGVITALMCGVTVFCTAKIYSTLRTIRAWNTSLTAPVYLAFSLATGAGLLTGIASLFGRFQWFQVVLAIAALVLTIVLKWIYWRSIDAAPRTHTMEAATGLGRIGTVSQWEVPHTAENFVQKEMGYQVARNHAMKLRRLVFLLLILSIVFLLLALEVPVVAVVAAVCSLLAAVVERWLFFAEAQHVSQLFYGAKSA
jgi:sulfite dehydrogenase (quinone) subunit SoeC